MRAGTTLAIDNDLHCAMQPASDVFPVVQRYLDLVDTALPRRVEGLYFVGSVALDDYQAGRSDLDFVAVSGAPLEDAELTMIGRVHDRLRQERPKPFFDGIYVTWADLASDPRDLARAPHTHEGHFDWSRGFEANPAVWLTLRTRPLPARGPMHPHIWEDDLATRQWCLGNLESYWRNAIDGRRSVAGRTMLLASRSMLNESVAWCIPGVSRLHYTVSTGGVTSKRGACLYALDRFPERWHPIVREALALRCGEPVADRARRERLEDLLRFMAFVIEDAGRLVTAGDG